MQKLSDTLPVPAATEPAHPLPPDPQGLARGPFVRVMTIFTTVLVLAMVAIIYWRDLTIREPSSAVIVLGDQTLDGAKIDVWGENGRWEAVVSQDTSYQTPVLLEPGQYNVRVTHKGHVILETSFSVERFRAMQYMLRSAVPIIAAPVAGETQVQVEGQTIDGHELKLDPIVLNAVDHFHAIAYLPPGEFRATATRGGKIVGFQSFNIQRGKPVELDFARPSSVDGS